MFRWLALSPLYRTMGTQPAALLPPVSCATRSIERPTGRQTISTPPHHHGDSFAVSCIFWVSRFANLHRASQSERSRPAGLADGLRYGTLLLSPVCSVSCVFHPFFRNDGLASAEAPHRQATSLWGKTIPTTATTTTTTTTTQCFW